MKIDASHIGKKITYPSRTPVTVRFVADEGNEFVVEDYAGCLSVWSQDYSLQLVEEKPLPKKPSERIKELFLADKNVDFTYTERRIDAVIRFLDEQAERGV